MMGGYGKQGRSAARPRRASTRGRRRPSTARSPTPTPTAASKHARGRRALAATASATPQMPEDYGARAFGGGAGLRRTRRRRHRRTGAAVRPPPPPPSSAASSSTAARRWRRPGRRQPARPMTLGDFIGERRGRRPAPSGGEGARGRARGRAAGEQRASRGPTRTEPHVVVCVGRARSRAAAQRPAALGWPDCGGGAGVRAGAAFRRGALGEGLEFLTGALFTERGLQEHEARIEAPRLGSRAGGGGRLSQT